MSDNLNQLIEYKGKKLSKGRYLFNRCLPENYPVIDEPIDKKKLSSILDNIVLNYPPKVVIDTLDKIKTLGFTKSSIDGYTLSVEDLFLPEAKDIKNKLTGDIRKDLKLMNSKEVLESLRRLTVGHYVESGARGSWDQLKQLVLCRGYVSDVTGEIKSNLIKSNLVDGLTQRDFFNSSWGARKGLLDTALSTGESGYLTRQLIYSTVGVRLGNEIDCGSTDYLKINVSNQRIAKSILWRYYKNEEGIDCEITVKNYQLLIGKVIELRSPIYCKNKKICKKCYGNLCQILHSSEIGIIATQAIGERITQLVLRTFHLSGVAQDISGKFDKNEDIISGINIVKKLLHKPRSLNKFDGSNEKVKTPDDLLSVFYHIFQAYKGIHSVHYEVIISAMMWVGNNLWRLIENRNSIEYEWVSILQIPNRNSWLLGVAFSNLKPRIIDGLINDREDDETCLSELFKF